MKFFKHVVAGFILGLGALAVSTAAAQDIITVANGVNMWDGQWHVEASPYGWLPWLYTSVQLPPIAGGGNPTIETQPSQYLKHLNLAAFLDGTLRKGDWAIWTDLAYFNLLAPSYTVMNNNIGTLDVMAGIRYTSLAISFSYQFTALPTRIMVGGGFLASGSHLLSTRTKQLI